MSTTTKLVTAEELFALGEDAPYELIRGCCPMCRPPSTSTEGSRETFAPILGITG